MNSIPAAMLIFKMATIWPILAHIFGSRQLKNLILESRPTFLGIRNSNLWFEIFILHCLYEQPSWNSKWLPFCQILSYLWIQTTYNIDLGGYTYISGSKELNYWIFNYPLFIKAAILKIKMATIIYMHLLDLSDAEMWFCVYMYIFWDNKFKYWLFYLYFYHLFIEAANVVPYLTQNKILLDIYYMSEGNTSSQKFWCTSLFSV
jgi:hypothetical protein